MVDSNRAAVVLFCGDPRREEDQKGLPPGFLAALHRSLRRTLGTIAEADLLTVETRDRRMSLTGAATVECAEESLGQRIDFAVRFCFASGYGRVIIAGGDVPQLTRDVVVDALDLLCSPRPAVVLGPSGDGGFYLAGFNRPPRFDWTAVVDRPEVACAQLVRVVSAEGIELELLPTIDDVDDAGDAWRLRAVRKVVIESRRLIDLLISLLLSAVAVPRSTISIVSSSSNRVETLRGPPLLPVRS
jgi:glycosyltransferase A (GT-A) superfamily protein (DUF2064 family)